jgi:NAD(P)-dependent dehydrogenase (short-subunit alcohol dehydrogenase family)
MSKVWFITGAAGGLGAAIAKSALTAGDRVVATDRNVEGAAATFKEFGDNVLALKLDVTSQADAVAAVEAAVRHFGSIDVLVNNAGYGQFGIFEENHDEDVQRQYAVNVFGLFNVTRAVLPVMREQRSGRIFNMSAIGGLIGYPNLSLYSSSKFAVEGFSESLALEVASFNIMVTVVEPGFMRTNFLDEKSMRYGGSHQIADYQEASEQMKAFVSDNNHKQTGDPIQLGAALVHLSTTAHPPLRFLAGSDAYDQAMGKLEKMKAEFATWQSLSGSIDGSTREAAE